MKIILLFFLGTCSIISTKSRLIEKITATDTTLTTESRAGSSPPIRLARQAYGDYLVGFSDNDDSQEFFTNYNRKVRHFDTGSAPGRRLRRDSTERVERHGKNVTFKTTTSSSAHEKAKSKPVLVKKPIPKYNEMDYDDDFQMKMSKSPVKLIDSGEHEDEDFNLDDYDFDVNHDEFIGRGKPLEPRIKQKRVEVKPKSDIIHPVAPDTKIKSKLNIHQGTSKKKERSAEKPKKTNEKDDYYDESSSTTKEPPKTREIDDEESDDSKEYFNKASNVRLVRSPWKGNSITDKFGDKSSSIVSKVLSILPMFPQVPQEGSDFEYHVGAGHHNGWSNRGLHA